MAMMVFAFLRRAAAPLPAAITPALALALVPAAIPASAFAKQADAPSVVGTPDTQVSPYRALVQVFHTEEMTDALFEQQLRDLRKVWLAEPEFAEMEAACPGLIDGIIVDLTPLLRSVDDKANAQLRNAFVGIFAANLTEQEALDARDFFLSDDGQLIVSTLVGNFTFENLAADSVAHPDGNVSREALARDRNQIVQASMANFDMPTKLRIGRAFRQSTWGPKLVALRPQMDEARLTILNAPFTPEEDRQFEEAFLQAFDAHLDTCM